MGYFVLYGRYEPIVIPTQTRNTEKFFKNFKIPTHITLQVAGIKTNRLNLFCSQRCDAVIVDLAKFNCLIYADDLYLQIISSSVSYRYATFAYFTMFVAKIMLLKSPKREIELKFIIND